MYYGQQTQQPSYYPYQYMTQPNRYNQPDQQIMQYGTTQQQVPAMAFLKGRLVSSIDEVRAAQIDFDGSLFIFPDVGNNCIYTKQITASGSAIINKYTLQEDGAPALPNYVTKEELDIIISQLQASIDSKNATIEQLQNQLAAVQTPKIIKSQPVVTSDQHKTNF